MNTLLKLGLAGAAVWYLFREQIASLAKTSSTASTAAGTANQVPANRAAKLKTASGASTLPYDQWSWYWQNAAGLGPITAAQMDSIIGTADRATQITAEEFTAAATAAGA